ncbi:cupin domain-containing protein [bacterium]|jgi:quercetin dioxygenase-like cupin family protein|nr:cupin domain-containing protein [bacterium]
MAGETKTEGAQKAGEGVVTWPLADVDKVAAGTGYSTSHGGVVEGERMLVGYIHKARGTGSRMHSHPNEQFNFVMQGTLMGEIDGIPFKAPKGTLIHVPADAPHQMIADPDDVDVIFLALKDLSHGIIGMAVDGMMTGPHYEEGFTGGTIDDRK